MNEDKYDFWIKNGYNVCFEGKHGVGKTARIISAFERNKLKWKYFSASTLDPWVDFVGVPKEVKDEKTGQSHIELIRPKCFADDDVEAIFLDEYNRSQPKVRNATMELIQFKSINGRKFNKLRIVWVAINPDATDEDGAAQQYDVERLDPAQKDRFQIQISVPYKPDIAYFKSKFGSDVGQTACQWWSELQPQEKDLVSPRRLDYAVEVFKAGGDPRDVFPQKINSSKFVSELKNGSYKKKMDDVLSRMVSTELQAFIQDENNYNSTIKYVVEDPDKIAAFFPLMTEEKQVNILCSSQKVQKYAVDNYATFAKVLGRAASSDRGVEKRVTAYLKANPQAATTDISKLAFSRNFVFGKKQSQGVAPFVGQARSDIETLHNELSYFLGRGTQYRVKYYQSIVATLQMNYIAKNRSLTVTEADLAARALYSCINSTHDYTIMGAFPEFVEVFGLVHSAFAKHQQLGTMQAMLKSAGARVTEFVKAHAADYV